MWKVKTLGKQKKCCGGGKNTPGLSLSPEVQERIAAIPGGGSVELINYTPSGDLLVVNAARCSFDKEHTEFDKKKDTKLINYLAKHKHVLPFRHPSATLRIIAPIYVLRQLGKHQVGFSWSEVSRRYIDTEPEFHEPAYDEWRVKAPKVKQGSINATVTSLPNSFELTSDVYDFHDSALEIYNKLLESGVCPEQARMVLPQSMFTTTVTTGTLLGWHHLVTLRTEEHTQKETQAYARRIDDIISKVFPVSWKALQEFK